jgi:hypothetical protein
MDDGQHTGFPLFIILTIPYRPFSAKNGFGIEFAQHY